MACGQASDRLPPMCVPGIERLVAPVLDPLRHLLPPPLLRPIFDELLSTSSVALPVPALTAWSHVLGLFSANFAGESFKTDDDVDLAALLQAALDIVAPLADEAHIFLVAAHENLLYLPAKTQPHACLVSLIALLVLLISRSPPGATLQVGLRRLFTSSSALSSSASPVASPPELRFSFHFTISASPPETLLPSVIESDLDDAIFPFLTRASMKFVVIPSNDSNDRQWTLDAPLVPSSLASISPSASYAPFQTSNSSSIDPPPNELIAFSQSLKGQTIVLHAAEHSSFARHLSRTFTSWGVDISPMPFLDNGPELDQQHSYLTNASFIVIDDHLDTLKRQLVLLRHLSSFRSPITMELHLPSTLLTKTPHLVTRRTISSQTPSSHSSPAPATPEQISNVSAATSSSNLNNHTNSIASSTSPSSITASNSGSTAPNTSTPPDSRSGISMNSAIIYFTPLSKYSHVCRLIQSVQQQQQASTNANPLQTPNSIPSAIPTFPQVVVIPKPTCAKRLLTALYSVVHRPALDPVFQSVNSTPPAVSPSGFVNRHSYFNLKQAYATQPSSSSSPPTHSASSSPILTHKITSPCTHSSLHHEFGGYEDATGGASTTSTTSSSIGTSGGGDTPIGGNTVMTDKPKLEECKSCASGCGSVSSSGSRSRANSAITNTSTGISSAKSKFSNSFTSLANNSGANTSSSSTPPAQRNALFPSPLNMNTLEYFSRTAAEMGENASQGIIIQSPDGRPSAIFFQPESSPTTQHPYQQEYPHHPSSPYRHHRRNKSSSHRNHALPPKSHSGHGNDTESSGVSPPIPLSSPEVAEEDKDKSILPLSNEEAEIEDQQQQIEKGKNTHPLLSPILPISSSSAEDGQEYQSSSGLSSPQFELPTPSTSVASTASLASKQSNKLASPVGSSAAGTPIAENVPNPFTPTASTSPSQQILPPIDQQPQVSVSSPSTSTLITAPSAAVATAPPTTGLNPLSNTSVQRPSQERSLSAADSGKQPGDKRTPVPKVKVLIVEDNRINQVILSTFLEKRHMPYSLATNGEEAVEMWKTGDFQLILMDIQLPIKSGVEATKEIRALESAMNNREGGSPTSPIRQNVIIVALTAGTLQSDRVVALAAGCNDFLTKPVSLTFLSQKILEWGSMAYLSRFGPSDIAPSPLSSKSPRRNNGHGSSPRSDLNRLPLAPQSSSSSHSSSTIAPTRPHHHHNSHSSHSHSHHHHHHHHHRPRSHTSSANSGPAKPLPTPINSSHNVTSTVHPPNRQRADWATLNENADAVARQVAQHLHIDRSSHHSRTSSMDEPRPDVSNITSSEQGQTHKDSENNESGGDQSQDDYQGSVD